MWSFCIIYINQTIWFSEFLCCRIKDPPTAISQQNYGYNFVEWKQYNLHRLPSFPPKQCKGARMRSLYYFYFKLRLHSLYSLDLSPLSISSFQNWRISSAERYFIQRWKHLLNEHLSWWPPELLLSAKGQKTWRNVGRNVWRSKESELRKNCIHFKMWQTYWLHLALL